MINCRKEREEHETLQRDGSDKQQRDFSAAIRFDPVPPQEATGGEKPDSPHTRKKLSGLFGRARGGKRVQADLHCAQQARDSHSQEDEEGAPAQP